MRTYSDTLIAIDKQMARIPKLNSRAKAHFAPQRHAAGMEFLAAIHDEITIDHPDWRKDDELPDETRAVTLDKLADLKLEAPALSDAYLTALGIPTTLASMSDKPLHDIKDVAHDEMKRAA